MLSWVSSGPPTAPSPPTVMASAFRTSRQPPLSQNPAYAPARFPLHVIYNGLSYCIYHILGAKLFQVICLICLELTLGQIYYFVFFLTITFTSLSLATGCLLISTNFLRCVKDLLSALSIQCLPFDVILNHVCIHFSF